MPWLLQNRKTYDTMTLKELTDSISEADVIQALVATYDVDEKELEGYRTLLRSLKGRTKVSGNHVLMIEHVSTEDGEEYEDVYGTVPGESQTYSLTLCPRDEWLGMQVAPAVLERYSKAGIVAHCLWEMTFHGFTDEQVDAFRHSLEKDIEEEAIEILDIDEMLGAAGTNDIRR